jgi:hypothetical protein
MLKGGAGGGGSGSSAFGSLTSGTNTSGAFVLGSGSSLTVSGTGTNQATSVLGVANSSTASAGQVGEIITSTASGVSFTNAVTSNITSISLTAGDWDVWGNVDINPAGTTTMSYTVVSTSTVSATVPVPPLPQTRFILPFSAGSQQVTPTGITPLQLASTTTVYLLANIGFAVSTLTCDGVIYARRRR